MWSKPLKWSYLLFGIALLAFLITGVLLDSTLASVPTGTQRLMNIGLIILPTLLGTVLGVMALLHKPVRWLLAILAILLNGLTALFFIAIVSFAG